MGGASTGCPIPSNTSSRRLPGGASTSTPSTLILGMHRSPGAVGGHHASMFQTAAAARRVVLELGPELADDRAGGHGGRVGEHADRAPDHAPHDLVEQVDLALLARAALQPAGELRDPPGALAAGRALATRLV